jgi:hypothetical protein
MRYPRSDDFAIEIIIPKAKIIQGNRPRTNVKPCGRRKDHFCLFVPKKSALSRICQTLIYQVTNDSSTLVIVS